MPFLYTSVNPGQANQELWTAEDWTRLAPPLPEENTLCFGEYCAPGGLLGLVTVAVVALVFCAIVRYPILLLLYCVEGAVQVVADLAVLICRGCCRLLLVPFELLEALCRGTLGVVDCFIALLCCMLCGGFTRTAPAYPPPPQPLPTQQPGYGTMAPPPPPSVPAVVPLPSYPAAPVAAPAASSSAYPPPPSAPYPQPI